MFIFETTGKIMPEQDKTNIPLEFNVPSGIERLIIDYEYSPKILEDTEVSERLIEESIKKYLGNAYKASPRDFMPVKNLVTLSLDCGREYRGAAHRQADKQHHEISKNFASPGFIKGEIKEGRWAIVLNVHCCACKVDYKVKVTGEGAE